MKKNEIKKVTVLGGGTMGQQIALICAQSGCNVDIYDIAVESFPKFRSRIKVLSEIFAASGKIPPEQTEQILTRIRFTGNPAEAAEDADLLSESVPENPSLKAKIFAEFNALCPQHTIFTTNTSTLLPSTFAEATGRPQRFAAFHFHDLRVTSIVDIMPHHKTSSETMEVIRSFACRIGLIPIVMKSESSGYIFNAMFSALLRAAENLAAEGIASVEDIDRAWMGVTKMAIGPFGMMDQVGLDTVLSINSNRAERSHDPIDIRNASMLRKYVEHGHLGEKSGRGFYIYPDPAYLNQDFIKGLKEDV
ncbi:MAG: 3-hydroxyacyl-CoA dehydrogenase [Oligoflexales bacterium]|nr:3-hydroxyacyl-CoA dehydrogenase [Oligoflexales bacterium]